jgi:hypothetical protein
MRALRQFWSQGTRSQVVVLVTAGAIVLIGCISVLLIGSSLVGGKGQTGGNASSSTATARSNARSTAAAGTATAAAGGAAKLGAPLADFIAAFGQPTQQPHVQQGAATDSFWGNTQQTVLITVHFTNGLATLITVVGPPSSTSSQTYNSCADFLPPQASSYSSAPPDTYFHSPVGNLVLENDDAGLCKVYLASS